MPTTRTAARACAGKRVHATKVSAQAACDYRVTYGGAAPASMNAYLCRHCHLWHTGHAPGQGGKRRR
jgi:hypothetical protein